MALINVFVGQIVCPYCWSTNEVAFDAYIGYLEANTYYIGNNLYLYIEPPIKRWSKISTIGPDTATLKCPNQSFWAYGLGECKSCKEYICAKITIKNDIVKSIEAIKCEEINEYDWECI